LIRSVLERTGLLIRIKKVYYAAETRLSLPKTKALFSHVCGPGSLVFDVGANLGQKTQIFANLGARVVSIEPEQRCCEYVRRRFRSSTQVTVVNAAVADSPGQLRLYVNPQTPEISTLDRDWLTTGPDKDKAGRIEEQVVEVVTLTQLIERFGVPDYVKIDVEGFETQVLRGLSVPVRHVSFEFHVDNVAPLIERLDLIKALGEYTFNYTLANSYQLSLPSWQPASVLIERLSSTPADAPQWGDVFARQRL